MTEPEPRAPQRTYSNHVLIGGGSSSYPILKTFRSGNFSRGRRNFAPKRLERRQQMSVKMRGPADVVIFSVTGQKYFTSARLGAVQGRNEASRPNDWATLSHPGRWSSERSDRRSSGVWLSLGLAWRGS